MWRSAGTRVGAVAVVGGLLLPVTAPATPASAEPGAAQRAKPRTLTVGEKFVGHWRLPKREGRPTYAVQWKRNGGAWRTTKRSRVTKGGAVTARLTPPRRGRYVIQVRVNRTKAAKSRTLRRVVVVRPQKVTDLPPVQVAPLSRPQPLLGPGATFRAYAVGDIGWCDKDENPDNAAQRETSELIPDGAFLLGLGDLAQNDGGRKNFRDCYLPTYGRLMNTTFPVPGNHEYKDPALAYFSIFGDRVGTPRTSWYAFQLGDWSFYQMNSNCHDDALDDCLPRSRQLRWLDAQLAVDTNRCVAVSWHHPHWAAAPEGDYARTDHLYRVLVRHGVDLLLSGHWHNYQRFARLGVDGKPDPRAPRQFVVGTGGGRLDAPLRNTRPRPEVARKTTHGVLQLDFSPGGYNWRFLPVGGGSGDSGWDTCSRSSRP